jgi:NAD(P)-dependent dehydrogenase (short-subunit alcohol dehydrogenase family)
VTGADHGLGRAFVEKFLGEGFRVFAGCHRLERDGASARDHGSELTEVPLDVRSAASVAAAAAAVRARSESLDLLINNAGINPDKEIPLEALELEMVRDVIDVNALGPLRVTQRFLPLLRRGERKVIVNISSEAGSLARCGRKSWFGYCMSKAALNMQTRILENYLREQGFRVFCVHPGWMRTPMSAASEAPLAPEESAAHIYALVAHPRAETPQFVQYDGTEHPW